MFLIAAWVKRPNNPAHTKQTAPTGPDNSSTHRLDCFEGDVVQDAQPHGLHVEARDPEEKVVGVVRVDGPRRGASLLDQQCDCVGVGVDQVVEKTQRLFEHLAHAVAEILLALDSAVDDVGAGVLRGRVRDRDLGDGRGVPVWYVWRPWSKTPVVSPTARTPFY